MAKRIGRLAGAGLFISLLAVLLAACAFGEGELAARASVGETLAPDMMLWGTQVNNGWSYLYKTVEEEYIPMDFRKESDIPWQVNAFASDPNALMEMFFISQSSFFTGEMGSKPVYAFQAPLDGKAELVFFTHGQSDVSLSLYQNETLVKVEGQDVVHFTTTGEVNGFTRHSVVLELKKGDMLYLVGATDGANREGWVNGYSVTYQGSGEQESEDNGMEDADANVYKPDAQQWGKQGNSNWFYMFRNPGGTLRLMDFHASSDIPWQADAFASDPAASGEMFFVSRNSCFVGELGSRPVYAFCAPKAGEIELSFMTHGQPDMCMRVLKGEEVISVEGKKEIVLNTTGEKEGFTVHRVTVPVSAGDMICLEAYTTGSAREAWVKEYRVMYTSFSEDAAIKGEMYIPDHETLWGQQDNHHWYYMFLDKEDNLFKNLAFVPPEDIFRGTYSANHEYLMIQRKQMHPSLTGSPAFMFLAPHSGVLELKVEAASEFYELSPTGTGLAVYLDDSRIWPEEQAFYRLPGEIYTLRLPLNVEAGDKLYAVIDALGNNINYDSTIVTVAAQYLVDR